jgi:hypothetical protein
MNAHRRWECAIVGSGDRSGGWEGRRRICSVLGVAASLAVLPAFSQAAVLDTPSEGSQRAHLLEPASETATDPQLEGGFPVEIYRDSGTYYGGPGVHILVGELVPSPDEGLEACMTALSGGPLYCWNHDGSEVRGWGSDQALNGAVYPALGDFSIRNPGREIVSGVYGGWLTAHPAGGEMLPGWPRRVEDRVTAPPTLTSIQGSLASIVGDGPGLYAYRADGSVPPGWPVQIPGASDWNTAAAANVDGKPGVEVFAVSEETEIDHDEATIEVAGVHESGKAIDGYPLSIPGEGEMFPAVGDLDGDGTKELVLVGDQDGPAETTEITIFTASSGRIEHTGFVGGSARYGVPVLADLAGGTCGDGVPELIFQTEEYVRALQYNGSRMSTVPGWPVTWAERKWYSYSAPVVGDLDGVGAPEVAFVSRDSGPGNTAQVRAYHSNGTAVAGFPKDLPLDFGAVPAIADLDGDGRNELIVGGSSWSGQPGTAPGLWVYDVGGPSTGGRIEWGQFMHNGGHSGAYRPADCPTPDTEITSHPSKRTTTRLHRVESTFTFAGGERFECRLDGDRWTGCASPYVNSVRARRGGFRPHTLKVRALSSQGTADPTPSSYRWWVRRTG